MSITSITLTRLKNEQHAQFHESVRTLLEKVTSETLGIVALFALYLQAFRNELEALAIIVKSELTAQISEQDRIRDSIFRGFSDTVKGFRNHFDPEMREAANRLWNVFLHYGNIAKKPLDAQTAATNDILREFQRDDLKEAIELLQLQQWCYKMDEENQKFHQLMMQRYNEPIGKTAFRMRTARVETDKFYRAITADLDNQELTGRNDEAFNETLIELNAIVKRFKNILAQQFGKKAAQKTGE